MISRDARRWFSLKRGSPIRAALGALRMRTIEPARRAAAAIRRRFSGKTFIGVTGSSGKTTTTTILRHILDENGMAWGPERGRNGVGDLRRALLNYPRAATHLVIEVGAGETAALAKSAAMLQPDIAVITMVRLEHYSYFRTLENVAAEKGRLAEGTRPGGVVVVNGDDPMAVEAGRRASARLVTFGLGESVDYRAVDIAAGYPGRLSLTIETAGGAYRVEAPFVARHFWLPVTAAFAAAVEAGIDPETAAKRITTCPEVFHRMNVLAVPDGPVFLLDTAKAPYHSLFLAFDAVASAVAPRKRIVLGKISDYAGNPAKKYRDAYAAARAASDEVIFINDRAHRVKTSAEDVETGRFRSFAAAEKLVEHLRRTAVAGEVILLKGSRSDHLERIALAFVQEVRCWRDHCGVKDDCPSCGMLGEPFETHAVLRREARRTGNWRWLKRGMR